jgi:hypothetical protein
MQQAAVSHRNNFIKERRASDHDRARTPDPIAGGALTQTGLSVINPVRLSLLFAAC